MSFKTDYLQLISNYLYSDHSISWTGSNEYAEDYMNNIKEKEILFAELDSTSVRAVYFISNTIKYPMIKGRFFEPGDFSQAGNFTVIGKNYIKNTYTINEEMYFNYKGKAFEVIGVIGLLNSSLLDQMLFFSIPNVTLWIQPQNIWTIDSSSQNSPDVTKLTAQNKISIFDRDTSGVNRVTGGNVLEPMMVYFNICIFTTLLLASYFFVARNENLVRIYQLMGYNPTQIIHFLIWPYLLSILGGFLIGTTIMSVALYQPYYHLVSFIRYLVVSTILTFISCLIFIIIILKTDLISSLKKWN